MVVSVLQLFAATSDGAPVYVTQGLEKCGIQFHGVFGFRQSELRNSRVELQLQTLEQDRMIDVSFRPPPTQNAVAQDEFHAFSFALQPPMQFIQIFEDLHGETGRFFHRGPFVTLQLPASKNRDSGRIINELFDPDFSLRARLFSRFMESDFSCRIIPAIFKPADDLFWRFRRPG